MNSLESKKPKLRFPEFTNDWNSQKFSEVFERIKRKNSQNNNNVLTISGSKGLVNQLDYYNHSYSSKDLSNYTLLKKDNFAYNKSYSNGYPMGAIKKLNDYDSGIVSPLYICFEARYKYSPQFLEKYFESGKFNRQIYRIAQEGARNHGLLNVNIKDFFEESILTVPTEEEQTKIADFLTAVDNKISALQDKKAALEKYKKGIMQQIFGRQIQFKDENGNSYPSWEKSEIGDLFEFKRTNSLSRSVLGDEDGIKNIHYGDIHTKLPSQLNVTNTALPKINIPDVTFSYDDFCKPGDIVMADASEDYADIGKCLEITEAQEREVVAGLHTFLLRPIFDTQIGFMGYLMNNNSFRKKIMKIATGASVLGVSKKNLEKLLLKLPCNEEQRKIADFLIAIDDKIKLTEEKLEQARQFKKGLLQQMFA